MRFPIEGLTTAVLTVCEIFSLIELKNRHFRPLYCNCGPSNINVIYTSVYIHWVIILQQYGPHSFCRCCLPNLQQHAKFRENSVII